MLEVLIWFRNFNIPARTAPARPGYLSAADSVCFCTRFSVLLRREPNNNNNNNNNYAPLLLGTRVRLLLAPQALHPFVADKVAASGHVVDDNRSDESGLCGCGRLVVLCLDHLIVKCLHHLLAGLAGQLAAGGREDTAPPRPVARA